MTYLSFLTTIQSLITTSSWGGTYPAWYSEICLEDEIESKTGTTYPAIFIVPVPFDLIDDMMAKYSCKIYMVDSVGRAPNAPTPIIGTTQRLVIYNRMVSFAQAFFQQLPDQYINDYPVTINPIIKWDSATDGIYFELTLNGSISCL